MEEIVKSCYTCVYGNSLSCSEDILCLKKGVLSVNSPCRKYKEDLTKKEVRRRRVAKTLV